MSAQRVSSRSRDSISSLPDEVLSKILSLLPHRLCHILVLPNRNATQLAIPVASLHSWTQRSLLTNSSIIKRFSLSCVHTDTTQPEWTLGFALPLSDSWNFTWRAHVSTRWSSSRYLMGFFLSGLPPPNGGVFFPNLKTFSLVSVGFEPCEVYEYLISGCPVLEELFIRYASPSECSWMVVNQSIAVSSPSIKRMSISYPSRDYWEPPASEVFRTPSLVYLDHSGYVDLRRERVLAVEEDGTDDSSDGGWDEDVYDEDGSCFGVEHNAEVHDDVIDDDDADIDDNDAADDDSDSDSDGEDSLPDVANLVEGISNVKTLHLSPYFLEVFDICCKSMPVFHKLLTLSFESDKERGFTDKCGDACVCIAKKKKKMEEEEKVCCLSTCQVKVLNISGYGGTGRERKQMRHFLGNLKCLETVKVGLVAENHHEDNSVNNHYQRITNALTKLPRVSSNCQIHFF
ncbi:hypothetical protein Bca4012_030044 [Brassica carinata]|uniref:FBD domain-containing protein n=1 Tax=Brassica carinata TaxID=52824 RepID=A0A8X7UUE8_BRACI|nr:hypothetical protein Bca52824_048540 [Brassica carinata]